MNEKMLNWTTALVSVAIIVTLIKCMIVGGAVKVPDPPMEVKEPEKEVVVLFGDSDVPVVYEPDPPDLSEYNVAPAAEYHEEYAGGISVFTDLEARMDISEKEIGEIIDWWTEEEVPGTTLKNPEVATAFIYASQQTGLDPIFLLALAGQESGWGSSKLHYESCNPYSIGMQDDGYLGLNFGDSYQESIIKAASWIRTEFYDAGLTNLYLMQYGDENKPYATDVNWGANIAEIMDQSYKVIAPETEIGEEE